jgi:hypothetical protein
LEICTATTGNEFAKIDQSKFDVCHRLMYRCPEGFTDGLNIDFRAADLESGQCVADIQRSNLSYDIILVDPWHEYEPSYRDMKDALRLLTDKGTIVVHDCLPPTEQISSPTWVPGPWCGVTFMAYVDFVTQNDGVEYRTIDTDYGCGLIQKCPGARNNTASLPLVQSWRKLSSDPKAAFQFLQDNKESLLHLVSVDEFLRAAP